MQCLGRPAPLGKTSKLANRSLTKASRGSSLAGIAPIASPAGPAAGMSFSEWTAASISPASRASSISLVNRPLPPTSESWRSLILSPEVVITVSDAAVPILSLTHPAWASASLEPRVPIRTCCVITPRPLPQGAPRGNDNKGS